MKTFFNNDASGSWRFIRSLRNAIGTSMPVLFDRQRHSPNALLAFMPIFLAQGAEGDSRTVTTGKAGYGALGSNVTQWFIIIGALLLVSIITAIVLIAYSSRRHNRRHRRHSHSDHSELAPAESEHRHRKRRHRRRSAHPNYPTNPTLAETGGLPPVRPDDQPPLF